MLKRQLSTDLSPEQIHSARIGWMNECMNGYKKAWCRDSREVDVNDSGGENEMDVLWNEVSRELANDGTHFWDVLWSVSIEKEERRKRPLVKETDIIKSIEDLKEETCCLKWPEHRVGGDESGWKKKYGPDCGSPTKVFTEITLMAKGYSKSHWDMEQGWSMMGIVTIQLRKDEVLEGRAWSKKEI